MAKRPLIVDLDGTLIKTDLALESLNYFITKKPWALLVCMMWLCKGRAHIKKHLAKYYQLDPSTLPYHTAVLNWLRAQKKSGRKLILATGSDQLLAQKVASHLKLFDAVLATQGKTNLVAHHKRDQLISQFGEHGYDYVGNSYADLAVWGAANQAFIVSSSQHLIKKARQISQVKQVFDPGDMHLLKSIIKALRPYQWVKNLLLFLPLMAAHQYGDIASLLLALKAFGIFCLTASSVYVLNDLVDIDADRQHDSKKNRPFASGQCMLLYGWLLWPTLLLIGLLWAWYTMPWVFIKILLTYYCMTLLYSFFLKRQAILDVLALASLYTLRIIAGAMAVSVVLSFWLLAFSMFLFLSLAFIKRFSELEMVSQSKPEATLNGRGYMIQDSQAVYTMGAGSGYLSVLVLALYVHDPHTIVMYRSPAIIWLACPALLYWISRAWLITHRGQMHHDPIVFALKDKISWVVAACLLFIFALALYLP